MSPHAGFVLLDQIVPRLRSAIPHCVRPVGAEDAEELVQDATAFAAQMLDRLEELGKQVTPGNIAYYTILHMKSGRRSTGAGRTDVMSSGGQLDGNSCVLSFEEPAGIDSETGEEIPLGDMLSCHQDDPSMTASRVMDWEQFLDTHDHRYSVLVRNMAQGTKAKETASRYGFHFTWAYQLRNKLAGELREYLGEDAVADSVRIPGWRGNIMADHEKAACKADRRRY